MTKKLRVAIRKLARDVAKIEGKKHQASFGDIEEILKDLAIIEARRVDGNKKYKSYPSYILADYSSALIDKGLHIKKKIVRKKK